MTEQTQTPNDQAAEDIEQPPAPDPNSASARYNQGLALSQRGEWDRALEEFRPR